MGGWGVAPSEFWAMTPMDFWCIYDGRLRAHQEAHGGPPMEREDYEAMKERLRGRGIKV